MEDRIRQVLLDRADDIPPVTAVPPHLQTRARRRIAFTVSGAVVTAVALVLGAAAGVSSLLSAPPKVPADRGVTPSPSPTMTATQPLQTHGILNGRVTFAPSKLWFSLDGGVVKWDESVLSLSVPSLSAPGGYFAVISDAWVPVRPGCIGSPTTTDELVRWIVANPELETSVPEPVTVGGVDALRIDVAAAPNARICGGSQFWTQGVPVVIAHQSGGHPIGVKHGARMRIYLLDLPGKRSRPLAIMIIAPAADFEQVVAEATPIVESFAFRV